MSDSSGAKETPTDAGAESTVVDDPARSQQTGEFVLLLRDRQTLKTNLEEKDKELNGARARNFELLEQVEKLEKELAELKIAKKAEKDSKKRSSSFTPQAPPGLSPAGAAKLSPTVPRNGRAKTAKHAQARRKPKKGGKTPAVESASTEREKDGYIKDTYNYYKEIAQTFPNLKLSVLLAAEEKFVNADVNKDGTIDADELETILESSSLMFTKQQVRDIVKQIDSDQSSDLDFMECLAVIDRLHQNKKTNLPTPLEQNKSTVCTIQ